MGENRFAVNFAGRRELSPMMRVQYYLLVVIFGLVGLQMQAKGCGDCLFGKRVVKPSLLEILTMDYPYPGEIYRNKEEGKGLPEAEVSSLELLHLRFVYGKLLIREAPDGIQLTDSLTKQEAYYYYLAECLKQFDERSRPDVPVFPNYNQGFGNYLVKRALEDSLFDSKRSAAAFFLNETANAMFYRHAEESRLFREVMGDLLLVLHREDNQPDLKFLAAFSYETACWGVDSMQNMPFWKSKAYYCLESQLTNPKQHNVRRILAMGKLMGSRYEQYLKDRKAWDAEEQKLTAEAFEKQYVTGFAKGSSDSLTYWPIEKGDELYEFVNKELQKDAENAPVFDPNEDFSNKSMDVGEIKSNVRYNLYALLIFAALGIAIGAIIWNYRKALKAQRTEDQVKSEN